MKRTPWRVVLILSVALVAYQNCTMDGFHATIGQFAGINQLTFDLGTVNATLDWNMKSDSNQPQVTYIGQVSKWTDAQGSGISLYPPILTGTTDQLNLDASPLMETSSSGNILTFGPQAELINETGDLSSFLGQAYTIGVYIQGIQISTNQTPNGIRIFNFYPADGSASGQLGLDIIAAANNQVSITAFEYFDSTDETTSTLTVPASTLADGMGIVIRFSNDPTKLLMSVNGNNGTYAIIGTPPLAMGDVTRQIIIHGAAYGQEGSFNMAEFAIWNYELQDAQVIYYSQALTTSYNQGGSAGTLPSPTPGTGSASGPTGTGTGTINPNATYTYLSGHLFNQCIGCHTGANPPDGYNLSSYNLMIQTGAIVQGSAENSPAYTAVFSGVMPATNLDGSDPINLEATDPALVQALEDWIQAGAPNN